MRLRSSARRNTDKSQRTDEATAGANSGSGSTLVTPDDSASPGRRPVTVVENGNKPISADYRGGGAETVEYDQLLSSTGNNCRQNRALDAVTSEENETPIVMNGPENHLASSAMSGRVRSKETLLPHNRFVIWSLKTFGCLMVLFFFAIPAFMKIYPAIIADIAFLNKIRWPPFINLDKPTEFGLNYTRSFRLDTSDGISLGAWHTLPDSLVSSSGSSEHTAEFYMDHLKSEHPVILYLHGNAGTRAGWHRVQLYKVLSAAGFHVITFDYRGYGDSTGSPSEEGLVQDSIYVFKWIKEQIGNKSLYIWGHSLGSAVATKTASRLCQEGVGFNGLILEAPFNNFIEAASNHPLSLPFRVMPWFTWVIIEGIKYNNIRFASDENIHGVTVPVVILHAMDDGIVPYALGRKLYEVAIHRASGDKVQFVTFDGEHGYGHKHIHKSPELVAIIRKFMSDHAANK